MENNTPFCVRWGILGAGNIANDFCVGARVLPRTEHRVVAVASRTKEKALKLASLHEIEKVYGSYMELLEDDEIDVVYVATVTHTHKAICLLAMNHGKHVLCEKALAVNAEEAKDIIDVAKRQKVFLMEGMWSLFFPSWQELKARLIDGTIGKPKLISITLAGKSYAKRPRFYDYTMAGGMLNSMGAYAVLLANYLLDKNPPVEILASGFSRENGVDKTSSVTLKYEQGCTVTFTTSLEFDYNDGALIIGDQGVMRLQHPYYCSTMLETEASILEFPIPKSDRAENFKNAAGFSYQLEHVRQCLMRGRLESPVIPHALTVKMLEEMDSIRKVLGIVYEQDQLNR